MLDAHWLVYFYQRKPVRTSSSRFKAAVNFTELVGDVFGFLRFRNDDHVDPLGIMFKTVPQS
jgi:hypothetical protein